MLVKYDESMRQIWWNLIKYDECMWQIPCSWKYIRYVHNNLWRKYLCKIPVVGCKPPVSGGPVGFIHPSHTPLSKTERITPMVMCIVHEAYKFKIFWKVQFLTCNCQQGRQEPAWARGHNLGAGSSGILNFNDQYFMPIYIYILRQKFLYSRSNNSFLFNWDFACIKELNSPYHVFCRNLSIVPVLYFVVYFLIIISSVAALRVCKRYAAPGPMGRGGPSKPPNF